MATCGSETLRSFLNDSEQPIVEFYTLNMISQVVNNPYYLEYRKLCGVNEFGVIDQHSTFKVILVPIERFSESFKIGPHTEDYYTTYRLIAVEPELRKLINYKELQEIEELKSKLKVFNTLTFWERLKFLFKGKLK